MTTKYRLVFRSGLADAQLFDTEEAAWQHAIHDHFRNPEQYLILGDGSIQRTLTGSIVATVHAVQECPLTVVGSEEKWFTNKQEFLVYFKSGGFDGIQVMRLLQMQAMVDTFTHAAYPCEVYIDDFHFEEIESAGRLLSYYSAWPIPEEWVKPPFMPRYSWIGSFIDWDSGEFDNDLG